MKQILSIVAHNRPGVLMRVTGLISRRGYNAVRRIRNMHV